MIKRGIDPDIFELVLNMLCSGKTLPAKHNEHKLKGNYSGYFECHIQPDWILVYKKIEETQTIIFTDTGTHSVLF